MVYGEAFKAYQKTSVETADTLKLTIMCYDAAIKDLQLAKELHEGRSIDATFERIRHAQDIVTELLVGLDYERGGEIAVNLSRLYNFMIREMIGIGSRHDTAVYDHLVHILAELKDAWEQIRQDPSSPISEAAYAGRSWGLRA